MNTRPIHPNPPLTPTQSSACHKHASNRGVWVASCIAPFSAWPSVYLLFNFPPKLRSHPPRTSHPSCPLEYKGRYRLNTVSEAEAPGSLPAHHLSTARQVSVNHLPSTFPAWHTPSPQAESGKAPVGTRQARHTKIASWVLSTRRTRSTYQEAMGPAERGF